MVLAVFITLFTSLLLDSIYMLNIKSKIHKTKGITINYYHQPKPIHSLQPDNYKSVNNKLFHHRIIKINKNEHKRFN